MKMTRAQRQVIALICLLPCMYTTYAMAPVVDESDNYATFAQNQAADDQPLAHEQLNPTRQNRRNVSDANYPDEQPIARDTTPKKSDSSNAPLVNVIQGLQQEIQELRGQLELQAHNLKVLQEQQLAFYKDVDARIHGAPQKNNMPIPEQPTNSPSRPLPKAKPINTSATTTMPTTHTATSNNPAEEQIRYLAAYDLIKTKDYEKALPALQSFTSQYPKGGYTANAHYWMGEINLEQKNYQTAISNFNTVIQQFPTSSKSAPSQLKMAYALADSGKKQDAIQHLNQVIKNYPDTNTAHLAASKLRTLSS